MAAPVSSPFPAAREKVLGPEDPMARDSRTFPPLAPTPPRGVTDIKLGPGNNRSARFHPVAGYSMKNGFQSGNLRLIVEIDKLDHVFPFRPLRGQGHLSAKCAILPSEANM
jgi:hypothetical protein